MKKAFIQLHLAVFLAGFTAILGKLIELNEGWLVWYRLLFSVLLLGPWLIYRQAMQRIGWSGFLQIAGVGLILAFHWVAFYGSVKYANVSVAVVCLSAAGFFTALLEPLLLRKSVQWMEVLIGAIAIAGIYIIFDFHPRFQQGVWFGLFSALGSALFPIFNKQLLKTYTPGVLTFFEFSGGWLTLCLLLPLYFQWFPAETARPGSADLAWLMVLVVGCTLIPFALQLRSLRHISAFTSTLTYNLEPVYGILLAFLFFQEQSMLRPQFYLGLFLIAGSIAAQMLRVWRARKSKS